MKTEGKETMTLGWAEEMAKKTDYACFAKEEPDCIKEKKI